MNMAASTRNKPLVYRLEEISTVKSKEDLLLLFPTRTRDRMKVTSLSPSINVDRRTSTATISFSPLSEEPFPTPSDLDICIDKDFYGFTPLYTPGGQIDVDIIAVTGLAGHAFGSWSTANQRMWLRDFLPRDIPQARILIYGYNSQIVNSQSRSILADFSSNFIAKFNAMRAHSHSENRPIIFIGHSLGCLMIKEVLVDLGSYLDRRRAPTRPTVKSIIFFGAPHRGLEVTALRSMVHGTPSEDLIGELKMHSPTLRRLNDGFRRVYEDVNILTIYEMESTASLRRDEFDTWERTGPPVMMVEKDSAILYWPMETLIGLNQDHSMIAKVDRGQSGCYDDICHFLQQSLYSTGKVDITPIVNARPLYSSASPSSSKDKLVLGRELCEAIKKGDSKSAQDLVQLVEKGSLAGSCDSPLILAIRHCPEVVSTLLDAGADLSARDGVNGSQAIHIAGCWAKNPDTVQFLLDAGAAVNASNTWGNTPLHFAGGWAKSPDTVQFLLDAGATVNISNVDGATPLHFAAEYNDNLSIIQVLIDAGAAVTARSTDGWTPLHLAANYNNNPSIIQVLIDAGAVVNSSRTDGWTPLHGAALNNNNPSIIQVLIDAGAAVNGSRTDGWTPLHGAALNNNNPSIIQVLIDAGAAVTARSTDGRTSLHDAARASTSEIVVKALILANADINARDRDQWTPLHFAACSNKTTGVIRALIEANADVNATSDQGFNSLKFSTSNENPEICHELLNAGAHPDQKDKYGCTALYWAIRKGNKAVVRHLLWNGAEPRAMAENFFALNDMKFDESVPSAARNEIRDLVSDAS